MGEFSQGRSMGPPIEKAKTSEPLTPSQTAHRIVVKDRLGTLIRDEKVRTGAVATLRTLANLGITLADTVPVVGDAVSWAADIGKVARPVLRLMGVKANISDTTPDVSKLVALGSEVIEIPTTGFLPSHAIETALQARYDIPRIIEACKRVREILGEELEDHDRNEASIEAAAQVFGINLKKGATRDVRK